MLTTALDFGMAPQEQIFLPWGLKLGMRRSFNETQPEKIEQLYRQSVEAGTIFFTNSFGSNAARLKLHKAGHRAYELSKLAAELGRNVAYV